MYKRLTKEERLQLLEYKMIDLIKKGAIRIPPCDQRPQALQVIVKILEEHFFRATIEEVAQEIEVLAFYIESEILEIIGFYTDNIEPFTTIQGYEVDDIIVSLKKMSLEFTDKELVKDALFQLYKKGFLTLEESDHKKVVIKAETPSFECA
ncbi:MAG TPA: hypothetical protein P5096_02535 [Patescibacteria group bacterium]|nr:hypothetical protein [Patescibacteria group bacterium]